MNNEENNQEIKVNDRRGQEKPEASENISSAPTPKAEAPRASPKKKAYDGPIEFSNFVMSLSTSAAIYMGLIEDPSSGIIQKNLPLARQQIDLIEMLHFKTDGNLTDEEKKLFDQVLYELKVRFVEASKQPV